MFYVVFMQIFTPVLRFSFVKQSTEKFSPSKMLTVLEEANADVLQWIYGFLSLCPCHQQWPPAELLISWSIGGDFSLHPFFLDSGVQGQAGCLSLVYLLRRGRRGCLMNKNKFDETGAEMESRKIERTGELLRISLCFSCMSVLSYGLVVVSEHFLARGFFWGKLNWRIWAWKLSI